jgi:hypothetical protein
LLLKQNSCCMVKTAADQHFFFENWHFVVAYQKEFAFPIFLRLRTRRCPLIGPFRPQKLHATR